MRNLTLSLMVMGFVLSLPAHAQPLPDGSQNMPAPKPSNMQRPRPATRPVQRRVRPAALPARMPAPAPAHVQPAVQAAPPPQTSVEPPTDNSKPERTVYNAKKMNAPSKSKFQDLSIGLITWQEDIKATRAGDSTMMQTQFEGLNFATSWNKFYSPTWRYWNSVDFTLGQVKGKGQTANIPDELKRQTMLMLEGSPGLMWRTSSVSEVGFGVPVALRYIKWDLIKSSGLTMDKSTSFSAGLSATYVNRFSARTSIHVTVAHQHMWSTTMWIASWNRVF